MHAGRARDPFARLDDRVALVTGAGSGIGRAVAIELAAAGATVLATSRSAGHAAETAALAGGACEAAELDVSNVDDHARIARRVAGHGRLDVLVANAGVDLSHEPGVERLTDGDWDGVLETNLSSVFRLVRALLRFMPAGSSIVTVGSANSLVGRPGAAAYVASKSGLLGLSRALAVELAVRGVRANCVCPGNIDTPLTDRFLAAAADPGELGREYAAAAPMNRLGTPREVAACIRFLASEDASFVTGAAVAVDGGLTAV